jgi:hypothetical protein
MLPRVEQSTMGYVGPTTVGIDHFSSVAVLVRPKCDDLRLAQASGFLWRHDGQIFLVSNWHVLSGRNPLTGQPLDTRNGACPNRIELGLNLRGSDGAPQPAMAQASIVRDGGNLWLQHPQHGQDVDVAVLVLPSEYQHRALLALNDLPETSNMAVYVGQDVFVLGYPLDPGLSGGLPIWKRGSIANEPNHRPAGLQRLLIDSATREGMSGAPVIVRSVGNYLATDRDFTMWSTISSRRIGIYSGRYGTDLQDQAQLGIVWDIDLVDEVCAGNMPGDFQLK